MHSPFPWRVDPRIKTAVFDANGIKISATKEGHAFLPIDPDTAADNAALIARATSLHHELVAALESIEQYGSDTLSGRSDGGVDNREWQREAVIEMRNRARAVLQKAKQGDKQ